MSKGLISNQEDDRRDFFRVNDTIKLAYKAIKPDEVTGNTADEFFDVDPAFALMRELRSIDHDNASLLRTIGDDNRDLELYLKGINRKVEMIASALISDHEREQSQKLSKVVISEGSLDFAAKESFDPGTFIALQITLLPEHLGIYLFGKVIRQKPMKNGKFHTVVHYEQIKDAERQVLAKHVMQVQIQEKRRGEDD